MQISADHEHRWGVILAGGEGVRLKSLTRLISGDDRPKQFCALFGGCTLLTRTRQRISQNIAADRTVLVLLNSHERFFSKELRNLSSANVFVQPSNRGTLAAIVGSLVSIVRRDKDAVVSFFPSDHHYTNEEKFKAGIELAFSAAEKNPEQVILLGVTAKHAETDYGWIEADEDFSTPRRDRLFRIKRFWEKPSPRTAQELLDRGCVWNTFVMVGRAQAFLEMIRSGAPEFYREFEPWMDAGSGEWDANTALEIYERLEPADFSKRVLSMAPERLAVLCLGDVGWSDLGDPGRVIATLSENGVENDWMASWDTKSEAVAAGR